MASSRKLIFLHFNDVYNIEGGNRGSVGGASRFASLVRKFEALKPLVLFSGDCFSPSIMSTITHGKQIPPVLNALGVHFACLGNHDLDFGLTQFQSLASECNFPWLVGNVLDKETHKPIGGLQKSKLVEWEGVKIGIMGLIEQDWLLTLATLNVHELTYLDFVVTGRELAKELRQQGAELIIAMTHMRAPNDRLLLQSVAEIDIVMGGHDHDYVVEKMTPHGNLLVKSGTDFRDLTKIEVQIKTHGHKEYLYERIQNTSEIPEDKEMKTIVDRFVDIAGAALDDKIGKLAVDMDGSFSSIRTKETNLGNFVCDILRMASHADICFLNSGTFRSDRIHPVGDLTKRDLLEILPMIDETVVLKLSGSQLVDCLENAVSQYPKLEGRFLQVSGLSFRFDSSQDIGKRILLETVYVHEKDETVKLDEMYTVCTKKYLAEGRDGFDALKNAEIVVHSENAPVLPTCIRYHFMVLEVLTTWKTEVMGTSNTLAKRFASKLTHVLSRNANRRLKTQEEPEKYSPELKSYTVNVVVEDRILHV